MNKENLEIIKKIYHTLIDIFTIDYAKQKGLSVHVTTLESFKNDK